MKALKLTLKIVIYLLLALIILFGAIVLLIRIPKVQNFITDKAISYVSEKTNSKIELEHVYIGFFDLIQIEGLYAEDLNKDTLAYIGELNVDFDILSLVGKKINISSLELKNTVANLSTQENSPDFNFQFIVDAFASTDTTTVTAKKDTSSSSFSIGLETVVLQNVRFKMDDQFNGLYANTTIGEIEIDMETFDLNKGVFKADDILIASTKIDVQILKESPPDTTSSEPMAFKFGANQINLKNNDVHFLDQVGKIELNSQIGELSITPQLFDMNEQKILIKSIALSNSNVNFTQLKSNDSTTSKVDTSVTNEQPSKDWLVELNSLDINQFKFVFDDNNATPINSGMDFSHLGINLEQTKASDIHYNGISDIIASIDEFKMNEKSGFGISEFRTNFLMDSQRIQLNELYLATSNNTIIQQYVDLQFNSLESISENINQLQFKTVLPNNQISINDLFYFSPDLRQNEYLYRLRNEEILLNANISGNLEDITIDHLFISIANKTKLIANGKAMYAGNLKDGWYDLSIKELTTSENDLKYILGDSALPSSIQLPQNITIRSKIKGPMQNLHALTTLESDLGNAEFDIYLKNNSTTLDDLKYSAVIGLEKFNLGQLMKDSLIETFSLKANINGFGIDPKKVQANINATISDAIIKNYEYADFTINGNYEKESFVAVAGIKDSNLIFQLDAALNLMEEQPKIKFDFNLEGVDLQQINFYEKDLRLKGNIKADIVGDNIDDVIGNIELRNFLIMSNESRYTIDSLLFVSIKDSINSNISLKSDLIDGYFKGNIQISEIGNSIQKFFKGYYNDTLSNDLDKERQKFSFEINIKNNQLLSEIFLPDLEKFEGAKIKGRFNAMDNIIELKTQVPYTKYGNIILDSLDFETKADGKQLTYNLAMASVQMDSLAVKNLNIKGFSKGDTLVSELIQSKVEDSLNYYLKALTYKTNHNIQIHFNSDKAILDGERWNISPNNQITFGDQLIIKNLKFSKQGESITLKSLENQLRSLQIDFEGFHISSLLNLVENVENDSIQFVDGILKGKATLDINSENFGFESDLKIDSLMMNEQYIGVLDLNAKSTDLKYVVDAALSGDENDIKIDGFYPKNDADFNFDILINQLNLKTIERFSFGAIRESQGKITADLNISGNAKKPLVNGQIQFVNSQLRLDYLNSQFKLGKEKISFKNNKVKFNQFSIQDSLGNEFKVGGNVNFENVDQYKFDLTIKSKNFQALNTKKKGNNDLFYGKVLLSSDISIKGDQNKPIIDAKIKLNEGTDFTFVLPAGSPSEVSREGVVVFVDKNKDEIDIFGRDKVKDTIKSVITGLDLTARIEIDKKTNLNIVVDPIAGDQLSLQGGGVLNSTIDQSGKVTLIGKYIINEGSYNLTLYDVVKRKFNIKEGSSITWAGDPLEAKLDIAAIFDVKAAPADLISQESTAANAAEQKAYQVKLPFEVYLMMKNELMSPDLSFKIELKDDSKGALNGIVYAKLQTLNEQESELNKQVFALIILKRFLSSNAFGNQNDGSNLARNSVSKVLNQQLNKLSDKYIKGVNLELNVDSYEDYSSTSNSYEGRTELNLAVSKSFFNDRISVKVGGDIDLEGERAKQNSLSDFAGDVTIEYAITEDGRYKAKLYRQNNFEGLIEGDITETGVSLIYTRDYDTFKELFKKPEEINVDEEFDTTSPIKNDKGKAKP